MSAKKEAFRKWIGIRANATPLVVARKVLDAYPDLPKSQQIGARELLREAIEILDDAQPLTRDLQICWDRVHYSVVKHLSKALASLGSHDWFAEILARAYVMRVESHDKLVREVMEKLVGKEGLSLPLAEDGRASVRALLGEFRRWQTAESYTLWQDPISTSVLKALEKKLRCALPESYREFLRTHNGLGMDTIWGWHAFGSGDITDSLKHLPKEAKLRKWVPIAYDLGGNYAILEMAPKEGPPGRVMLWWHQEDRLEEVAPDYHTWLVDFMNAVERGDFKVNDLGEFKVRDPGVFYPPKEW